VITYWVGVWEPDAEKVINEAFVVDNMWRPFRKEELFMEGVEYYCLGWGLQDAHTGDWYLLPVCIPKLDEIILEDYVEGFDEHVW
jgi:hypothetical protein